MPDRNAQAVLIRKIAEARTGLGDAIWVNRTLLVEKIVIVATTKPGNGDTEIRKIEDIDLLSRIGRVGTRSLIEYAVKISEGSKALLVHVGVGNLVECKFRP